MPDVNAHVRAALDRDPPSHAYLFHGPGGSGKRTAARALAARLLAEGAPDPGGVRERVERGTHPDLTWVVPTGAHEMRVEDVEEPVISAAVRTPFEAARRVFVIERADTMNDGTANRMLKTLEEPAPHVHLVLLTSRLTDVLPTIVSRCQLVRFDPAPPGRTAGELASFGVEAAAAEACSRLALGDGELARSLAFGGGPALRDAAEGLVRAALAGEAGERRPWKAMLELAAAEGSRVAGEQRERAAEGIDLLPAADRKRQERELDEQARRDERRARTAALDLQLRLAGLYLRDLAATSWGASAAVHNRDRLDQLAAEAAGAGAQAFTAGIELIDDFRSRLLLNVGEELALEVLGYRLEALLAAQAAAATGR